MTEWVTSDHHFGHANIIRLAHRPFADLDEMNAALIERWNAVVRPRDTVWHLGDFAWRGCEPSAILRALNGRILWLHGNHDPKPLTHTTQGGRVQLSHSPYAETKVAGERIVCCHYPLDDWNGRFRGALHIHGHTHSREKWTAFGRANACVEAWDYAPVNLENLVAEWKESRA